MVLSWSIINLKYTNVYFSCFQVKHAQIFCILKSSTSISFFYETNAAMVFTGSIVSFKKINLILRKLDPFIHTKSNVSVFDF